jgi:hypothetical protein
VKDKVIKEKEFRDKALEDERLKKQKEIIEIKEREQNMVHKLQSEIEKEKRDKREKRQREKDICMKII